MRILVSGGATREPIDAVRFITNFSTGATAAALADLWSENGHEVTLLAGAQAVRPRSANVHVHSYETFQELDRGFQELLGRDSPAKDPWDLIVHLAAVGDYSVRSVEAGGRELVDRMGSKIDSGSAEASGEGEVVLRLARNFKIISRLKSYVPGPSKPLIVAFKLTHTRSASERLEAVTRLGSDPGVDFVVHNDLSDMRSQGLHHFTLYRGRQSLLRMNTRAELAAALELLVSRERLPSVTVEEGDSP